MAFETVCTDIEIILLSEVSHTSTSYAICYMWNLKKGHNELCRTDIDSQTLKNLWFPNETCSWVRDGLWVWDGKAI